MVEPDDVMDAVGREFTDIDTDVIAEHPLALVTVTL